MLSNKKFNIVLSLLIAVGIWAYVIGETNPQDTKTFRDIPIQLINEQTLEENNLALVDVSAETVNVTLTGARAEINRIDEREITATVNLAEAAAGENQLKINIRVPDNVELTDKSLNKVTITVDARVSKEIEIVPEYEGTFESDQEPITIEMNRSKVTVTGAESLVEKVDHVRALVGEGEVSESLKTIGSRLTPVDADGNEIERLELSAKTVQVTAQLANLKTVKLEVPVNDDGDGDVERSVSAPKTITIKGKSSDLEEIETVTAETVDVSGITKDTAVEIRPVLPEGVQVSNKSLDSLYVKVTVTKLATKTITLDTSDIDMEGLSDGLNAELKEISAIKVTLSGKEEDLKEIEKEDISLLIDLTELDAGTHQVALQASCSKEYTSLDVNPEEIEVIIE